MAQLRSRPWGPAEHRSLREQLRDQPRVWDLIVVGGGITGVGVARDAAMRGLSVLVLEARDIAFGTSSRSTRLIHGGVRYLEQGDLALVYEALRERAQLYETAPHLVQPTRFLFPAYRNDPLSPWQLRVGLTLYDTLNFYRGDLHEYLDPEATLAAEPLLNGANLCGAVRYEDAVTDDARLTLSVAMDARRHGAEILCYAKISELTTQDGIHTCFTDDGLTIQSRAVVVATGPWSGPQLLGLAGENLLSLSKGVHLVLRATDVPVRHPLVIQTPSRGRILFAVPWGSRTYLGTTDTPYVGDPGQSGVTEGDERELLELFARVIPAARLGRDRIISAWAGVRPLVRAPGAPAGDTLHLSRKHRILRRDDGALGIVGGKLTTYRAMAEEVVDLVVDRLLPNWPQSRPRPRSCTTEHEPLVPGEPISNDELEEPVLADLWKRHGPLARALVADASDTALQPVVNDLPYRWCEVDHGIHHEGVSHAIDLVRRRVPLVLTDPELGATVIHRIARKVIDARGGNQQDLDDELERYREEVRVETRRTVTLP